MAHPNPLPDRQGRRHGRDDCRRSKGHEMAAKRALPPCFSSLPDRVDGSPSTPLLLDKARRTCSDSEFQADPMRKLPALLAIAVMTALAAPAHAQEAASHRANSKGAYVTAGVGGGWSSSPSANGTESGTVLGIPYSGTASGTASLGGGVAVDAGIGYDFGNSIRGEVTYVLRSYAVGDSSLSGSVRAIGMNFPFNGNTSASGNLSTNSVMFSGYYDFKSKSKFTPYVGAGIGYTSVSIPTMPFSATVNGIARNNLTVDGGSGSAFGYQAKLGVSYAVSKPADVFAEAIYQGSTGVTISEISYGALNAFSVRAGARFRFGR